MTQKKTWRITWPTLHAPVLAYYRLQQKLLQMRLENTHQQKTKLQEQERVLKMAELLKLKPQSKIGKPNLNDLINVLRSQDANNGK